MATKLVIVPEDSMWWLLRPEFVTFIDKVIISKEQYQIEEQSKEISGYHKVTWDRLNVLLDNNILEIREIILNKKKIEQETNKLLTDVFDNTEQYPSLVDDMIFSYNYWINYNKQKIDLVPNDQEYHKSIIEAMPLWEKDLELLKNEGYNAFNKSKGIKEYTLKNIIKKVLQMKEINESFKECPLTALREYEPFLKFIKSEFNAPIITEKTLYTYNNKIPSKLNGSVHLPIEPNYEFMRFKLSKLKFQDILKSLINNYKKSREKVKTLQKISEEITYGLSIGKFNQKVTQDFLNINTELLNNQRKVQTHSKYLSYSFFGLSLIPNPLTAGLFGFLGLNAKKIAEFFETARFSFKGITPNGLSAYYSFNESLMDISKLNKFPDIQKENSTIISSKQKFWR